jgi:hypothetical protein
MMPYKEPGSCKNKYFTVFIFLFSICFFRAPLVMGQKNEIGVLFGGTYYLGDLNPSRQFALTHVAIGGLYRHNFGPHLSARVNGVFGSVEGNDALIKYNEDRNLRFVSNITELSGQLEVNFLPFEPGNLDTPFSPYLFGGGGIFWFNPKAQYPIDPNDPNSDWQWISLRILGTEGQGNEGYPDKYKPFSSNFLFGVGFKFNISRNITGGVEWGMRRTGTDYLDDVSTVYPILDIGSGDPVIDLFYDHPNETAVRFLYDRTPNPGQNGGLQRGDPTVNDWYSFAGFVIAFKIKDSTRGKCDAYN